MKLRYHIVDVFTDRPLGGNPLAVFTEGRTVPESAMQAIANELNLSETTFVLPPGDPANNCRVRIFTPAAELPMAGHPTIGTAFVLAREGLIASTEAPTRARFEEGVGVIPISIRYRDGAPEFIEMNQPLPQFGPPLDCVDRSPMRTPQSEIENAESRQTDSNRRPADYKSAALPAELCRQKCGAH
jgi:trans-2,3-dihydro-3-hydroxyanthranilate isomerase